MPRVDLGEWRPRALAVTLRPMSILLSFVVLTVSMFVATKVLDGFQIKGGLVGHVVVAAVFALLNWLLGWALFAAITIGTLGLALLVAFVARLVVTAILLKITDAMTSRLHVRDFKTAFLAALVMAVAGTVCDIVVSQLHL
jgi:uncharacterized membrane protein YvlD (DUF360 family)